MSKTKLTTLGEFTCVKHINLKDLPTRIICVFYIALSSNILTSHSSFVTLNYNCLGKRNRLAIVNSLHILRENVTTITSQNLLLITI